MNSSASSDSRYIGSVPVAAVIPAPRAYIKYCCCSFRSEGATGYLHFLGAFRYVGSFTVQPPQVVVSFAGLLSPECHGQFIKGLNLRTRSTNCSPPSFQITSKMGSSEYSPYCVPFNNNALRTPRKIRMVCAGAGFAGLTLAYKVIYENELLDLVDFTIYEREVSCLSTALVAKSRSNIATERRRWYVVDKPLPRIEVRCSYTRIQHGVGAQT
jgi:hypothetical protein